MSHPQQRYQVVRELGQDPTKDRVTHLAKDKATQQPVIIKQFQFSKIGANWAGCEAYKAEVQGLMKLNHPGVPRYLTAFPIENGFCTVQQYKQARPLSELEEVEPAQIQQIAMALLEILVYLQNQNPPVIHRNIKPENVLIDEQQTIYLVDFGFDYLGSGRNTIKTSVAGTAGFMPREQSRDRGGLTEATDLFAAGMTLACLLTQTSTADVQTLNSQSGELSIRNKVANDISFQLVEWLSRMTRPYPKQRFPNAAAALEALNQLEVTRAPEAILRPDTLELTATEYGEKLSETIVVTNPIPDTLLQGQWSIAPHSSESHSRSGISTWISFKPARFQQNQVECEITIDTRKLLADCTYMRDLVLNANTAENNHTVSLKVQTAPLTVKDPPIVALVIVLLISIVAGCFGGLLCADMEALSSVSYISLFFGMVPGFVSGTAMAFGAMDLFKYSLGAGVVLGLIARGIVVIMMEATNTVPYSVFHQMFGVLIGIIAATAAGYVARHQFGKLDLEDYWGMIEGMLSTEGYISILTSFLGIFVGIGLLEGFFNWWLAIALLATGIPLFTLLSRLYGQNAKVMSNYLKLKPRLIKP